MGFPDPETLQENGLWGQGVGVEGSRQVPAFSWGCGFLSGSCCAPHPLPEAAPAGATPFPCFVYLWVRSTRL